MYVGQQHAGTLCLVQPRRLQGQYLVLVLLPPPVPLIIPSPISCVYFSKYASVYMYIFILSNKFNFINVALDILNILNLVILDCKEREICMIPLIMIRCIVWQISYLIESSHCFE